MPFLLRAVTHLCAPGFFLLMGVGMALFIAARIGEGWGNWRVARFFLIRGVLLIVFQQFLENPAWYLGLLGTATGAFTSRGGPIPGGGTSTKFYLGVLYGLGSTMVVWGLLFRLPTFAVIALSMAAIGSTQVVVSEFADPAGGVSGLSANASHSQGTPTNGWYFIRRYRGWELPDGNGSGANDSTHWLGSPECYGYRARALVLFAGIRLLDGFGNFHRAAPGWIGFFNLTKYPPDLSLSAVDNGDRSVAFAVMDVA